MTLSDVIARFATGTYIVRRRAVSTPVRGRSVPGALTTFPMVACIQPLADGRILASLPQGDRGDEVRLVFSDIELRSVKPEGNSDVVLYKTSADTALETWVCIKSEAWEEWGGGHWRAVIARRKQP